MQAEISFKGVCVTFLHSFPTPCYLEHECDGGGGVLQPSWAMRAMAEKGAEKTAGPLRTVALPCQLQVTDVHDTGAMTPVHSKTHYSLFPTKYSYIDF